MKNEHFSKFIRNNVAHKDFSKGQNIELTNKLPETNQKNSPNNNLLNNSQPEDEDVLQKFKAYQRRKHLKKNTKTNEKAFSTVRNQIKNQFSLGNLGKIEWAKEHASANRPMNKIQEFTTSTNFCNCCNLPCETPGVIEPFSFCDNTENFKICGKAVPLYFYFIRYCILWLILVLLVMSIPITIFNSFNLSDIDDYCNSFQISNTSINEKNDNNVTKICEKYSKTNNTRVTNFFNWFYQVSSDNIYDYNNILKFNNKSLSKKSIFINYSLVGFFCMICLFIINIFYIILFKAQIKAEKLDNIQPSDYTVLITNLQKFISEFREKNEEKELNIIDNNAQEDLTSSTSDYEYFNTNIKTQIEQFTQFLIDNLFYSQKSKQNLDIFNLNLCYKLNDFMVLKEMEEKCKYRIFQIENNPYQIEKNIKKNYLKNRRRYFKSPFTYIGLDWLYCSNKGIPLDILNQKRDYYDKNLNCLVTKAKLKNFCGCVFATFNTIEDKEEFYNNFPHFFIETALYYIKNIKFYVCCCLIEKKNKKKRLKEKIKVYLAPEPEDVIWQNMEFTLFQRFYRIIIIYCISFLLIGIAFNIVYLLNNFQDSIEEKKNWSSSLKYTVSFSITIIVSLLNLILEYLMKFFTKIEKQKSMTSYYLSFSIKLTIFTFMTSALVPFISNYITHHHDLKNHENQTLITNIFFIFLSNSFLKPIIWTINAPLIVKKIRICIIERKKIPNSMHFKTQKELNDLYELPEMDIALKYSYISMVILMTMFYLPIFPLGVPISILGLILLYFCEKYNFTHHYKRPEMLNEKLGEFHFNFFIYSILSYCLGDYFFTKGLFENDTWPIVNIVLFSILSIIPYTKPITYYFNWSKEFHVRSKPINDIYFTFYNDYQRQNPFTKKEGMYFYVNELQKRGYASKFIYDILIKNIEKINVMEIYYFTSLNPTLKEAQQSLTRVNNQRISIDDLKRSITRIFREKLKKSNHKKEIENREHSKSSNIIQRNIFAFGKKEKEKKNEEEIEKINEINEDDDINNNLNIDNNIKSNSSKDVRKHEFIDNRVDKRRYTETTKPKLAIKSLCDSNLKIKFQSRGSFLLNQYKDPLLLSIGLGINNLAFMEENNDIKKNKNKSNLDKISSISNEERSNSEDSIISENSIGSENSNSNFIVEEKEEEDEEDEIRKMNTKY